MKKLFKSAVIWFLPVIIFAGDGDASIWRLLFTWENAGEIIAVIIAILSTVVIAKYQKLTKEIGEAIKAFTDAKSEDSPGGKKITDAELAKISVETLEVIEEIINLVWKRGITKPVYWIISLLKKMFGKKIS